MWLEEWDTVGHGFCVSSHCGPKSVVAHCSCAFESPEEWKNPSAQVPPKPIKSDGPGYHLASFLNNDFIYLFLEKGSEGEREGEKHPCERKTAISCLLYTPEPQTKPTSQACTLTGNRTFNLLLYGTVLNPLSHTSHGSSFLLSCSWGWLEFPFLHLWRAQDLPWWLVIFHFC